MIKVNNKKAIEKLTKGTMKINKTRNVIAVIAIAITTFLFLTVFTIGIALIRDYDMRSTQQTGTTADAGLNAPTEEQENIIKSKEYIDVIGRGYSSAISETKDGIIAIVSGDENFYEFILPAFVGIKGHEPVNSDEILLSEGALEILGIKSPKKGMEISIPCRTNFLDEQAEVKEQVFKLSGWYDDSELYSEGTGAGYTAESFYERTENKFSETGSLQFSFTDPEKEKDYIEQLTEELELGDHQVLKQFYVSEFTQEKLMTGVGIAIVVFLIILTGYLVIYNVFYLSVTKDIRFYGLLKTIGTSSRQLKKIVGNQAGCLALIGIPAGLLAGSILLYMVQTTNAFMGAGGMLSPEVYVFAILFTLLTLWVSIRRSAKKVSCISPVEAVRFTGGEIKRKKGRKSSGGGKWYRMAYRNVFRDRKRAVVVLMSLFTGLTLFSVVLTAVGVFDTENMVAEQSVDDIEVLSVYEDVETEIKLRDHLNQEVVEKISNIDGVKSLYTTTNAIYEMEYTDEFSEYLDYFADVLKEGYEPEEFNEVFYGPLVGISREDLEKYYPELAAEIDLDAFERGESVLGDSAYDKYYSLPDTLYLKSKENSEEQQVTWRSADIQLRGTYYDRGEGPVLFGSERLVEKFAVNPYVTGIYISTEKGKEGPVQAEIEDIVQDIGEVYLYSRQDTRSNLESATFIMQIVGSMFTCILAFVGIMNYINIMMTSIQTRRRELSTLESIGMTGAQIQKMLIGEGLYYGGISILLVWTAGFGLSYFIYAMMKASISYAVFRYPFGGMVVITVLILAVCVIVPVLNYRSLNKASLTERIREAE